MKRIIAWFGVRRNRAYIYRVACALGAVLVAKHVISEGDLPLYDLLATVVLGLAAGNTPTRED
jgi:hypothetical protein